MARSVECLSWDPSAIASCALDHYQHHLGTAGKPKDNEWTVYSAIVAHDGASSSYWVVTCATGSKCTALGPDGWVLRDAHAEALCRRGLVRELWMEVLGLAGTEPSHCLLEAVHDGEALRKHQLRDNISLHLYISDAPCGDASIYRICVVGEEVQFTGAKKVVAANGSTDSDHNKEEHSNLLLGGSVEREPDQQSLGVLRTKSGRSNLPAHLRSSSMSCSDKLVQWGLLGLQGEGPLLSRLAGRIRLSSICVSRDSRVISSTIQQQALERAIVHRICTIVKELKGQKNQSKLQRQFLRDVETNPISVHVVDEIFSCGKAHMDMRLQKEAFSLTSRKGQSNGDALTGHTAFSIDSQSHKKKRKASISTDVDAKHLKVSAASIQRPSPCGFSVNWQQSSPARTELVVGARGIRQGKKPRCDADYRALASRLSRAHLMSLAGGRGLYREWKTRRDGATDESELKSYVMSTSILRGWLKGTGDFSLEHQDSS